MLGVVARYRARAGAGDDVAAILAEHVVATRAEEGCLEFDAWRSVENEDEFVLIEKYRDEAAFESHRGSAHFKTYIEGQVLPLLIERTWRRYADVMPERD